MPIDRKKERNRGSYRDFLRERQPIDLGKIKASLSREFYQASCGIERFLAEQAYFDLKLHILQNSGVS